MHHFDRLRTQSSQQMAHQHGQIQHARGNFVQASIQKINWELCHVRHLNDIHMVSFQSGDSATATVPARSTRLRNVQLIIEVNELSRTDRTTLRMAQKELSVLEQSTRLAYFHQDQQFQHVVQMQSVRQYLSLQLDLKQH